MKRIFLIFIAIVCFSCTSEKFEPRNFTKVAFEEILDDSVSIRALTLMDGNLAFAGSNNIYGMYNPIIKSLKTTKQEYDTLSLQFRAVASTKTDFFMLSISNPALLFKTGDDGKMHVVYTEGHEKVFYDSMKFWNDMEGIAMGDPTAGSLSIIITRDGGNTWNKISCDRLPKTVEGEAAFAASNTNIAIVGNMAWIVSGGVKSRVYFSPDKGTTWEVFDTPIVQGKPTEGIYSVDFYNEEIGIVVGGDYSKPEDNVNNKAITTDGGKTWQLVSSGEFPGYVSCVQYVPNRKGKEVVAVGFNGVSFSNDGGYHWKQLSAEAFHTIKFLNDSVAYAAGNNRIAQLTFKE